MEGWIEAPTHLGGTLELVLGSERDVEEVLVGVDERVHDRSNGGDTSSERKSGNGLDTRRELGKEGRLLNVEDGWREDGTVVIDLNNRHTVGERRDVQHVEQSGFGRSDLLALSDDLDIVDDFNGTTGNLGRDTESLEERGLSWLHTGVTGRDVDVDGGKGTSLGRGGDDVGDDDLTDVLEVTGSEDETNVSLDVGEELLELGEVGEDGSERTSDHGVLSHKNDTLATEGLTDLVDLLRRNVVDVTEEDGRVLLDQSTELCEVDLLFGSCSAHCERCVLV